MGPRGSDDWLVIIDPQAIFADPVTSGWGSPMFAERLPAMASLAAAYGRDRTVITRFVADPGLGGSWASYYDDWAFALVPDDDPLYAVAPALDGLADHVVTEATFGKWGARLPAADAGATVRIAADACAGSTPENHQRALDAMALFGPQITIT